MSKMDDFNEFLRKYFNEIKNQQGNLIQPKLGLHGSWSLPDNVKEFKFEKIDNYSIDQVNDLIVKFKLKCDKSEYVLNNETYVIENWSSEDGQIMIQKIYKKIVKKPTVETVESLKIQLEKALQEERYEDAARIRDKISKL